MPEEISRKRSIIDSFGLQVIVSIAKKMNVGCTWMKDIGTKPVALKSLVGAYLERSEWLCSVFKL